jgi:P-type Cu2+ transporter
VSATDLSHYVTQGDSGVAHIDLAVEGISCAGCIGKIERNLTELAGVSEARVNFTLRRVGVDWREGALEPAQLVETIERLGYKAHPFVERSAESESDLELKRLIRSLAVAGFAAMNIMLFSVSVWAGNAADITPETRDLFHWLSALIALPAAAYAGQPFYMSAFRALRGRHTNMDVPISIAVILALGVSVYQTAIHAEHAYFDSAIMLLFFLLAGRVLDQAMRRKTRAAAGNLAALKGETAERLLADGGTVTVPSAALAPQDKILIKPGDRIAADGTILSGSSAIDESLITGETLPKGVSVGDAVYAGTINRDAVLTVLVSSPASESLADEVQKLLEKASEIRSRRVILADRAARYYAPFVHLTALFAAIGWIYAGAGIHQAVIVATTVLIITCPCALALAVPAVQVVAAGALFRRGIFLNSGDAIERLAEADTIVFDKTGTLTMPELKLDDAGHVPANIVRSAARLALSSRHPLAGALAERARGETPFSDIVEVPGKGIRTSLGGVEMRLGSFEYCDVPAPGDDDPTASYIAYRWGDETAVFAFRQRLRADAVAVIGELRARGLDCRILSGDRLEAVASIAEILGIEDFAAGVKPAEKIEAIESLAAAGRKVAMVGDGLNDAPALASAHVSLSPISAVDLTRAEADAVFLGEKLAPILGAIDISRRARRLMTGNIVFSILYNICAVPLAIFGIVTPLIAALAMSGSSLIVTLNALRAKPATRRKQETNLVAEKPAVAT